MLFRSCHPGAFDHRQTRGLHRREAATAVAALPPPADRGAVFAGPRVDDPRVGLTTERTTHLYSSNLMSTARPWAGSCSLAARASKIGRASCRERIWIAGVSEACNKKNITAQ